MTITIQQMREIYKLARAFDNQGFVIPDKIRDRLNSNQLPEMAQEMISDLHGVSEYLKSFAENLLMPAYWSGIENGKGFGLFCDDEGNVNIEVDRLRVRKRSANPENLFQQIHGVSGTLIVSSVGKIKMFKKTKKGTEQ